MQDDDLFDGPNVRNAKPEVNLTQVEVTFNENHPGFDPDRECAFCCETLVQTRVVPLPCSQIHIYHTRCIEEWLTANNTCPTCRAKVSGRQRQYRGQVTIYALPES